MRAQIGRGNEVVAFLENLFVDADKIGGQSLRQRQTSELLGRIVDAKESEEFLRFKGKHCKGPGSGFVAGRHQRHSTLDFFDEDRFAGLDHAIEQREALKRRSGHQSFKERFFAAVPFADLLDRAHVVDQTHGVDAVGGVVAPDKLENAQQCSFGTRSGDNAVEALE